MTSRSRLRSSSQMDTPARLSVARAGSHDIPPVWLGRLVSRRLTVSLAPPGPGARNSARDRASRAQRPGQRRGDRRGAEGPHAAQGHARVLGLEHDAHAARGSGAPPGSRRPAWSAAPGSAAGGEVLHHPGQLGQAEDAVAGQVADVGDAGERQQVVLADRCGTGSTGRAPARRSPRRWGTWSAGTARRRTARRRPAPSGPGSRAAPRGQVDPERGQEVGGGPLGRLQVDARRIALDPRGLTGPQLGVIQSRKFRRILVSSWVVVLLSCVARIVVGCRTVGADGHAAAARPRREHRAHPGRRPGP